MFRSRGVSVVIILTLLFSNLISRYSSVQAKVDPADGAISGGTNSSVLFSPPNQPVTITPANGAANVSTEATLQVHVTDPENDNLQVSFYGRQKTSTAGQNFTIAAIPDTQFYTVNTGGSAYFNAETTWIANNQVSRNIVFATHTGDITQNGDNNTNDSEWIIADTALSILERDPANLTER
jgi:hypothetical protein